MNIDVKRICSVFRSTLVLTTLILVCFVAKASAVSSQNWSLTMGAQSKDAGRQAMAFLPNEVWIYAGDSITWTTKSGENHTVTFVKQSATNGAGAAGTTRPSSAQGCSLTQGGAVYSPGSSDTLSVTGGVTNCVNSGPFCDPDLQQDAEPAKCTGYTTGTTNVAQKSFTVTFANPGNFKLVCLIHADMTGAVHVMDPATATLPHNQFFYDDEARDQAHAIIGDVDSTRDAGDNGDSSKHVVLTPGETVGYGGGKSYLAVMRFVPSVIHVHVGDTVEWIDTTASEPHTVTFGDEPAGAGTLIGVSDTDTDVDREGTLPNSITNNPGAMLERGPCTVATPCADTFNSATFGPAQQEIGATAQKAINTNRVSITFTQPGSYDYFCILHDELGMRGTVVVGGGKKHRDRDDD